MPKVKVTKFNFSDQMLEKAKSDNPLVGALARIASEMIEDGKVSCQQTMWIDTDKVVAVGEVVKSKDDAGVPDVYTIYFSHGGKPDGWQITADSYDEFMQAWTGDVAATFDREPGGLVEEFRKELKETKEAMERGDYKVPAGLGPVKYIGIGNSIFKEVDGQREERIEIVYPDDDNIDEKSLLQSSVLAHADEILNFAGGDEQMHATEERLLKDWMNAYGAGYRDCRTKAVIERSLSGKAKVTFKATFLY